MGFRGGLKVFWFNKSKKLTFLKLKCYYVKLTNYDLKVKHENKRIQKSNPKPGVHHADDH